jgi:hypothetical protein
MSHVGSRRPQAHLLHLICRQLNGSGARTAGIQRTEYWREVGEHMNKWEKAGGHGGIFPGINQATPISSNQWKEYMTQDPYDPLHPEVGFMIVFWMYLCLLDAHPILEQTIENLYILWHTCLCQSV